MAKFLLAFSVLLFYACTGLNTQKPLKENENFYILSSANKTQISFDDFFNELLKNDIILLGERHDEPKHKASEIMIIQALNEYCSKHKISLDIAFEMFASANQTKLNKAKQNKNTITPSELQTELNWDKAWDYKAYQELINLTFYSDMNLLGANLSKEEIKQIYNGVVPLNGNLSTQIAVKEQIKNLISLTHELKDENMLTKLVEIQQFKDRRMADILVHNPNKIVLIAGKFHVSKKIGIPLHIKDFKSDKKVAVVIFNFDKNDLEYQDADYIFVYGERK
ncbi:ChaN family lipoprotein [Campylobacter sp. US33a]|uniref:ChaN family lipoprotein n=1 Tax=Campylobacter sp. CCS1377 TaxID=3158229 RepID=A0AAU7E6R6_9BACT|nr:ChaN family lipoprotein [Campylobacter sp. US33a]MCW1359774.1 ChaN family lipoprotein [Campylobacter jejuni]TEY04605.1 iron transporter [Campylobacter sp. US33a]